MYYNTQTHTFGHSHTEVARETNSSFAVGELVVGDYRLYEYAPEPEYDAATHRIEPSNTVTQRTGQHWLRGWDVIALTPAEIEARFQASVPDYVSTGAVRRALIEDDLMPTVEAAFNAIVSERQKALLLVDWEYEPRLHRDGRVIVFLQTALGMTDRAVDDFFISANAQEGKP